MVLGFECSKVSSTLFILMRPSIGMSDEDVTQLTTFSVQIARWGTIPSHSKWPLVNPLMINIESKMTARLHELHVLVQEAFNKVLVGIPTDDVRAR